MDLNYDNDWYRYFGRDSTIHTVGRSGSAVYGLDDGLDDHAAEAGAPQEDPANAVRERLAEDHAGDKD